jgi:L-rhamnose mutarotase
MKIFGQVIKLKPEKAVKYIKYHTSVWPGVLKTIKECSISNYSIYFKDNWLFAYFEYTGNDFEGDINKMAQDELIIKWWDVVKPLMEPLDTRQAGEF